MNPISISVAPATRVIQRRYCDLPGAIELMKQLRRESVVDGFEFQYLAEWDAEKPPRDERKKRFAAWNESQKYTIEEIAALLQEAKLPILSLHANRDVGICLCADDDREVSAGKRLIHKSLSLAEKVNARVCVFHLWDTWKEDFDPVLLHSALREIAPHYPDVKASVENVPTHLLGFTPFELVKDFKWITLDLQWAAMYDELDRFESVKEQIVNVHLRGQLEGGRWVLNGAPFEFYHAVETIRNQWGYSGPLTMEPTGLRHGDWENLAAAMSTLRAPQPRNPSETH